MSEVLQAIQQGMAGTGKQGESVHWDLHATAQVLQLMLPGM